MKPSSSSLITFFQLSLLWGIILLSPFPTEHWKLIVCWIILLVYGSLTAISIFDKLQERFTRISEQESGNSSSW